MKLNHNTYLLEIIKHPHMDTTLSNQVDLCEITQEAHPRRHNRA